MQNPPRNNKQVLNNDGTLRELPPLPNETSNASSYFGYGVGEASQGIEFGKFQLVNFLI